MTERNNQQISIKLCNGYYVYMLPMWVVSGLCDKKTFDHDLLMLKKVRLESSNS